MPKNSHKRAVENKQLRDQVTKENSLLFMWWSLIQDCEYVIIGIPSPPFEICARKGEIY
jgi:hypothetical protein